MRVEARERRINQLQKEQSQADLRVAKERRGLNETIAENKLKTDKLQFKIAHQSTKIKKCEEDNAQIQRHIDLRRMERDNKDAQIEQLKKEIENTKKRIEIQEIDLIRVEDDMKMLKRQVVVPKTIQPHQGMHTSAISIISNVTGMGEEAEEPTNCELPTFG